MCALLDQLLEFRLVKLIIAIAEQDDAIGLAAVFIIDMPVGRKLLERDQEIVIAPCCRPCDRGKHRKEEGVYPGFIRRGVFEKQQRKRVRSLCPQAGGVFVNFVVELLGDGLDAFAGLFRHRRAAAQRARNSGLRNTRKLRDVKRRWLIWRHVLRPALL